MFFCCYQTDDPHHKNGTNGPVQFNIGHHDDDPARAALLKQHDEHEEDDEFDVMRPEERVSNWNNTLPVYVTG